MGALLPGEHEVADDVGLGLCAAGYAEPVGAALVAALVAPTRGAPTAIESAAIEPPEHVVLPKPKKHKPKGE